MEVAVGADRLVLRRLSAPPAIVATVGSRLPAIADVLEVPCGDLRIRVAMVTSDDLVVVLPDRALAPDVTRLHIALAATGIARSLGIQPWSHLVPTGAKGRGGAATAPPVTRRVSWTGDEAVPDDSAWRTAGVAHPDGYRDLHPFDAWTWIDRLRVIEVGDVGDRHLPGAMRVTALDPAAIAAAVGSVPDDVGVLLASPYGYDDRVVARHLVGAGCPAVFHLLGGVNRWHDNDLPTESAAAELAALPLAIRR